MILQAGEQGIASEQVLAVMGPSPQSGYLYLTNTRLVFEGLFSEPSIGLVPRTLLDLHLVQVTNVVAVAGKRNRNTLRVEAGRGYVYTFVMPDAHTWANFIIRARSKAPSPVSAAPASSVPPPVIVNVQQASSQPTVFLHCTHCGSLNAAGSVHCTSCGATL